MSGEGHVSWGQPFLPSQESGVPALRNFGGSPVFIPTSFNAEQPNIRHGNTYGEGRILGSQPRHFVARFVSGIAEFLVR